MPPSALPTMAPIIEGGRLALDCDVIVGVSGVLPRRIAVVYVVYDLVIESTTNTSVVVGVSRPVTRKAGIIHRIECNSLTNRKSRLSSSRN
jgi:hypothetical protein